MRRRLLGADRTRRHAARGDPHDGARAAAVSPTSTRRSRGTRAKATARWPTGRTAIAASSLVNWPRFGRAFDEAMEVDLERFELLWPFDAALNPIDCGPRLLPCLLPGAMAASAALQTRYYARDHAFGVFFETGRMADIAQFLARFDADARRRLGRRSMVARCWGPSSSTAAPMMTRPAHNCAGSSWPTRCAAAASAAA